MVEVAASAIAKLWGISARFLVLLKFDPLIYPLH
jgi:hypothetical protein